MAELHVWMNGARVGVWFALRTGTPAFRYDADWVRAPQARALSLSLPITAHLEHRGAAVAHYFDNLLPDSRDIRRRLGARFRARSTDAFDLLSAIGRDCVGAVQLLPPGAQPQGWNRVHSEPLTAEQVARTLANVTSDTPLGRDTDDDAGFRISIAGAQEKTALLKIGNSWHRPLGATPTTHILKLPLGLVGNLRADMSDSVENEWLCAQLMAEFGIPMAGTEMAQFGAQKVLVVQRFDRRWQGAEPQAASKARFKPPADAWIARLPQEDFCQALGVAPQHKYESDGGPSMHECLRVLGASARGEADGATFALAQFAFWLLAATDGHAKNFSIRHRRGGAFELTPLYDVLSAWPIIGSGANQLPYEKARLAMALRATNAHYRLRDMQARHWQRLAASCGPATWGRMLEMAQSVEAVFARVESRVPPGFPARTWDAVQAGAVRHAQSFLRMAEGSQ
ncbi:type II toxin-antitoxin system HipA family toxin [Ideonella sp. BN130291]|uniref:type II toxin-antitoxin system HipA family toxin n=1 Tax=Ideonella sp. BN130291 TaxID=3112940 RepID=UPI002E2723C3|nr:type II toxin-antitoxin system HipA family toxin [Ideonella sp. BN130291]